MNKERDQNKNQQQADQTSNEQQRQRSSSFNESSRGDDKSTRNVEEEADLEQQRKEALTERD